MGREKSTNIFSFESEKCPCSLFLPENNGCCDDKHEVLIVDDSQTTTVNFACVAPDFFEIGSVLNAKPEQIFAYTSMQFTRANISPPPKEPLFKINCSFVFYDDKLS